ncbi:hypothetical protein ACFQE0_13925 [Methylobacterium komagatae]|uniref:Uncharacterized protein n=1 Tax=Methylobacterium komagatae TaxID=374425 RepID=A0ABW2BJK6_9HYPH
MADAINPNLVNLLRIMVGAHVIAQGQIGENQNEIADLKSKNADLEARFADQGETILAMSKVLDKLASTVAELQGHAETVVGESGIATQLGDLNELPALQEQLAAAMPAPVEAAPVTEAPAAAPAQDPAPQAVAA